MVPKVFFRMAPKVLTKKSWPARHAVSVHVEMVPDLGVKLRWSESRESSDRSVQIIFFSIISFTICYVFVYTDVALVLIGGTELERHPWHVTCRKANSDHFNTILL